MAVVIVHDDLNHLQHEAPSFIKPFEEYRLHSFINIKSKAMAIIKVIEILSNCWEDAAQQAIIEASKTIKNLRSIYIKDHSATIDKNNKIEEYRITANLSFEIEGPQKSVSKK